MDGFRINPRVTRYSYGWKCAHTSVDCGSGLVACAGTRKSPPLPGMEVQAGLARANKTCSPRSPGASYAYKPQGRYARTRRALLPRVRFTDTKRLICSEDRLMPEINRIVILGGHGRVARLATEQLQAAGYVVDSLIRDIQQTEDIRRVGGKPFELDLETADVEDLKNFLYDALAVVFAAGAGGGDPESTHAVDYAAATRAIDATEQVGVSRFVLVSYANAATDVERLDADDAFYPYARAKHDADAYLRESDLDYTILGPARLTDRPL